MNQLITYESKYNLLLEALAYFGRRAAGSTPADILQRLEDRGITGLTGLRAQLQPLADLMQALDAALKIPDEALTALFGNLPGFPRNTVGSCCPAFLLYYPLVPEFNGSLGPVTDSLRRLSREELAYRFAVCLDLTDDLAEGSRMSESDFSARVLALSIPAESKVAILDLLHNAAARAEEAAPWLQRAIDLLRTAPALPDMTGQLSDALSSCGGEAFLSGTSSLRSENHAYLLRPFVFGFDTNLSAVFSPASGMDLLYCGVLRQELTDILSGKGTPADEVFEAIKLLGDRTRFDILCYLRDHEAYGQELAERFGVSRNTIHHHMGKLVSARLVRCTVDGNRVYYATDSESLSRLLERQRTLLLRAEE